MKFPCLALATSLPPIDEIVDYIKSCDKRSVVTLLKQADESGNVILQPRCGVGSHHQMIELLNTIDSESDVDVLTLTVDSYTRLLDLDKAREVLVDAPERLNGYPLVAHGFKKVRQINERFEKPIQVRHGSPDGRRLFAESIAGGISSFEGGGIGYNLPYCRHNSLRQTIEAWREVDEAVGILNKDHSIPIERELFGTLTAVLVPPCISLMTLMLEAVLAANEGCKYLSLAYPQSGNIYQDVAALKAIRVLGKKYLPPDVKVFPVLHEFMGVFPKDRVKSDALIFHGGLTARLGNASKVITKTYQEAIGIPDAKVNAEGIRMTRMAFEQHFSSLRVDQGYVDEELSWILRETSELIDPVICQNDLITSIVSGFEDGCLDIPFPSNPVAKGEVVPVRDRFGAVRIAQHGSLTFSKDVINRNLMLSRTASTGQLHNQVRNSIMYFKS